jgi:hypothetical protein
VREVQHRCRRHDGRLQHVLELRRLEVRVGQFAELF